MNFGQNLYQWFLSNAQSLVLMAIVVIGIYLGFKREFSKLIGFLVVALVAVGLVFNCRATHSGLHKRHIIISNFSKKKAQSHLNDTIMPLFLHFISSMPGC